MLKNLQTTHLTEAVMGGAKTVVIKVKMTEKPAGDHTR